MATDATGTPTSLGIPTYNTAIDDPSGNGFNAAMASIDTLVAARIIKPAGIATGETNVWNGTTFARSSVTKLASGNFGPVVNADVDAAAAISYSKLNLASSIVTGDIVNGTIVDADLSATAAVAVSKLAVGSAADVLTTTGGVAVWAAPAAAGVSVLSRATTTVDVQTTLTETSLFSFSVPGNTMSTNKMLRLSLLGDYLHNNVATDTVTIRIKFGGTTFFANASNLGNATGAGRHPWVAQLQVANAGATNSQMIAGTVETERADQGAPTTGIGQATTIDASTIGLAQVLGISTLGTIDTTASQTIDVTVQWSASSANNSWRMRYAVLELV